MNGKHALSLILLGCACIFGSDYETVNYTDQTDIGMQIGSIVDNECIQHYIWLDPREQSPDHFYLIESPDLIDSVFNMVIYEFEWVPRLEEFFPENGMLLVYTRDFNYEDGYSAHQVTFYGQTVYISLDVNTYTGDNQLIPGINCIVIPIGIIPQSPEGDGGYLPAPALSESKP